MVDWNRMRRAVEALARDVAGRVAAVASRRGTARGGDGEELRRLAEIDEARRQWHLAQRYFDAVGEPELVDQAIHRILAAERQYMYLLRRAREQGAPPVPLAQVLSRRGTP